MRLVHIPRPLYNKFIILGFVYRLYVLGGIRLAASGPVLVQQPAAAGRVSASWQRRAYACGRACCGSRWHSLGYG